MDDERQPDCMAIEYANTTKERWAKRLAEALEEKDWSEAERVIKDMTEYQLPE